MYGGQPIQRNSSWRDLGAFEAKMTRQDNDSNVLCLPARVLEDSESAWKELWKRG